MSSYESEAAEVSAVARQVGGVIRVDPGTGQEHDSVKAIDLLRELLGKGTLLADTMRARQV